MPTSPKVIAIIEKVRAEQATFIDLGNCGLTELPDELFTLTGLQEINLGRIYWKDGKQEPTANKVGFNNLAFNSLKRLTTFDHTLSGLYLSDNRALTDIGVLAKLPLLQTLDLSFTGITGIGVLAQLPQLHTLNLTYTRITDIGVLAQLTQLKTLHLSFMGITDIGVLAHLPQLKTLHLSDKGITDIRVLAQIPQLHTLYLINTGISDIGTLVQLPLLQNLFLSNIGITDIGVLAQLPLLKNLDLGNTGITDISVLAKTPLLQNLNLSDTGISHIGALAQLPQLHTLNLSNTGITDIGVLAKLPLLQNLFLSNTGITDIEVLAQLPQLHTLNLSDTGITDIGVLAKLPLLQNLFLSNTGITDIGVLAKLPLLQMLFLRNMDIADIDGIRTILLNNPNLEFLSLDEGITGIPEGLESDAAGLRDFFRKQHMSSMLNQTEPNRSLKLILLGNTRAGKSQLLNRLLEKKFEENSTSTDGLNVVTWLPTIQGNQYRISCFDFGGQDFYHATHNLYLDNKALYIVLWHPHLVEESQHLPPGYWLGNIAYFTEDDATQNMAIWSIQNRADEWARQGLDSDQMTVYGTDPDGQFYLSILEAQTPNSRWKVEWDYFRQSLDRKIQALAQNVTPSNYEIMAVRDEVLPRLRKQKRMVVSLADFEQQCAKNVVLQQAGPVDYSSTLLVLRAAGELLWYPDTPSVANYIIIDPTRWAGFIFSVLGRDGMAKNDGEFDRNSLKNAIKTSVVHADEESWLPDIFVTLLQEYQLIFEKPGVPGRYVVPQYLPNQQLAQYLQKLIPLTFVVLYEHYIPFWRITHFITQKATTPSVGKPHYWRYGIIYEENDCTVMVRIQRPLIMNEEPEAQSKLYVHVEGPPQQRNQFLTEIIDFFARVHRFRKSGSSERDSPIGKMPDELLLHRVKHGLDDLMKADGKPAFIKRIQFSVNDRDYFKIDGLEKALGAQERLLKSTKGTVLPVPALFYPLLNYQNTMPKRIFFSYAHADAQYRRELDVHFASLKRGQYVETWHDMEIMPGEDWDQRIKDEIEKADLVLVLISPDFMNSSYIWAHEIPAIGNKFVPIFLRPCDFDETVIAPVQGLPAHYEKGDNSPQPGIRWIVSSQWQYRDEAYLAVINGLKQL